MADNFYENSWNESVSDLVDTGEKVQRTLNGGERIPEWYILGRDGKARTATEEQISVLLNDNRTRNRLKGRLFHKGLEYPLRAPKSVDLSDFKTEIPQDKLSVSTSQDQFKFPTFQEMSDAIARVWYEAGNNPYLYMWMDETDPEKKKQLERQAEIYQKEMEKNSREAVKDYNENEQGAVANWLANNLDAFDLATSPISAGLAPAKFLAKAGPLARLGMEAGIQAGLEGTHAGIEGENVLGGAAAGAASGLIGLYPALKTRKGEGIISGALPSVKEYREAQKLRRELIGEAEPYLSRNVPGTLFDPPVNLPIKNDETLRKTIKGRLNQMKDGPLVKESDIQDYITRTLPENAGSYFGDIRNDAGIITKEGFETQLNDIIRGFDETFGSEMPRGERRLFQPSQKNGEPPLLGKILDMLPEKVDEYGRPIFEWEDYVNALLSWKPGTDSEKSLKNWLLRQTLSETPAEAAGQIGEEQISNMLRRQIAGNLLEAEGTLTKNYPGIGLAALQPLYNTTTDIAREGMEGLGEGVAEGIEDIRNAYRYGKEAKETLEGLKGLME